MFIIEAISNKNHAIVWNRRNQQWVKKDDLNWSYRLNTDYGYLTEHGANVAIGKLYPRYTPIKASYYENRKQWIDSIEKMR